MLRFITIIVSILIAIGAYSQAIKNYQFSNDGTGNPYSDPNGTRIINTKSSPYLAATQDLPFDFWYMGVRYNQVKMSDKGAFSLGSSGISTNTNNLATHTNGRPIIAPLWDYMEMDATNSGGYVKSSGFLGEREYTLSWKNFEWDGGVTSGASISFSATLYEATGAIMFHYNDESRTVANPSASIGLSAVGTGAGNFMSVTNITAPILSTDTSTLTETNNIGDISVNDDQMFSFTPVNKSAAPTDLSASTISSSQIDLTWTDASSDELGFAIYFSTHPDVPLDPANYVSLEAPNTTSKSVTGLDPCTKYYFKVLAIKESHNPSNITSATTNSIAGAKYYVNDGTHDGNDVFTDDPGDAANNGTDPATPKLTISSIISSYALTDGDTIFVDAGTFSENVVISNSDDGSNGCGVTFIGVDSSKTIINPGTGIPLTLSSVDYVKFKNFKILGNGVNEDAVEFNGGNYSEITHCWIINERGGAESAIDMGDGSAGSTYNSINNCRIDAGIGGGLDIDGDGTVSKYHEYGEYFDNIILSSGGFGIGIDYANYNNFYRNKISGTGTGIQFDGTGSGPSYYNEIYNNYVSIGTGLFNDVMSTNNRLQYNSFYCSSTCVDFDVSGNNAGWNIKNNIFYTTSASSTSYCIQVAGSSLFSTCDCNWYYLPNGATCASFNGSNRTFSSWTDGSSVDHSRILFGDENSGGGSTAGNDPLFKTPASNDLDLNTGSPCFDAGCSIDNVTNDIYDNARESSPTIGAFDESTTILPIDLISFEVSKLNSNVSCNWNTLTETNNNYFTIERSNDGINYTDIGQVEGAGKSSRIINYQFIDRNPLSGTSYYRLKQTDYDGKYSYSAIRSVNYLNTAVPEWLMYPNPAQNILMLRGEIETLNITDVSGKLVLSHNHLDVTTTPIDISALAKGSYFVEVTFPNGKTDQQVLLIQR